MCRGVEDRVYRVGEVAKICRFSCKTIQKFFDRGYLKGFRVPGEKRERRISHNSLVDFMREYGIPEGWLEDYIRSA